MSGVANSPPASPEIGEFSLTGRDFSEIARIIHQEAGIVLAESKSNLVYSRLAKRLRALGMNRFEDYCRLVQDASSAAGLAERDAMIAALTTNVTRFFREPHHFTHLREHILPALLERARSGQRVRIWSAACSSGQEPYSIALTILAMMAEAAQYDVKILATDIDPNMITQGQAGIYEPDALAQIPAALRDRWFSAITGRQALQANETLRAMVTFRRLNLIQAWPMQGKFNAIFCRNVVIYFDNDTQSQIWARMVPLLIPGGALYIGHSERISGPAEALVISDGITTYRATGARGMAQ